MSHAEASAASQQPRQLNELLAAEQRAHQVFAARLLLVGTLALMGALALGVAVLA